MFDADADRCEQKRRSQQIPQPAHIRPIGGGTVFAEWGALEQGTRRRSGSGSNQANFAARQRLPNLERGSIRERGVLAVAPTALHD
jgi:hypothetical protein